LVRALPRDAGRHRAAEATRGRRPDRAVGTVAPREPRPALHARLPRAAGRTEGHGAGALARALRGKCEQLFDRGAVVTKNELINVMAGNGVAEAGEPHRFLFQSQDEFAIGTGERFL